jgi:hypothetical protein
MIEPKLQHNRDEFERLNRRKLRAVLLLFAALFPFGSILDDIARTRSTRDRCVFAFSWRYGGLL